MNAQSSRPGGYPIDEFDDFWVSEELVNSVEAIGKLLFGESAVYELVASTTKQGESSGEFSFFKVPPDGALAMAGAGNQMMASQFEIRPSAKFAALLRHAHLIPAFGGSPREILLVAQFTAVQER